ncbi:Protein of unknown function [Micromonospora lupini str. Lupac 08]|uniref:Uncharacterized protein n=1 Tax=Micromonospora lupini str. Lupac 08 TaxID=1150864 RepID=I0L4N9_9ACTN|nr:Protein of unknown function [Micromonospora lupini str. Lupac 08]
MSRSFGCPAFQEHESIKPGRHLDGFRPEGWHGAGARRNDPTGASLRCDPGTCPRGGAGQCAVPPKR